LDPYYYITPYYYMFLESLNPEIFSVGVPHQSLIGFDR